MIIEVRNVFEKCFRVPQRYSIEQNQVLMNLAHISHMWNNRHSILASEHTYGEKFAYPTQPRAIGLEKVHAASFQIILEDNTIGNVLAKRQGKGCDRFCQLKMSSG
jgi:hypothetical protein